MGIDGKRLRALCEQRGLYLQDVANFLGVTRQAYMKYENGSCSWAGYPRTQRPRPAIKSLSISILATKPSGASFIALIKYVIYVIIY